MRSARRHAVDIERGIGLGKSGSLLLELDSGDPSKTDYSTSFFRQNGPASAAPVQEGHFWKRSETKKRILRVAQRTQTRTALQELLESLPN